MAFCALSSITLRISSIVTSLSLSSCSCSVSRSWVSVSASMISRYASMISSLFPSILLKAARKAFWISASVRCGVLQCWPRCFSLHCHTIVRFGVLECHTLLPYMPPHSPQIIFPEKGYVLLVHLPSFLRRFNSYCTRSNTSGGIMAGWLFST